MKRYIREDRDGWSISQRIEAQRRDAPKIVKFFAKHQWLWLVVALAYVLFLGFPGAYFL